MTTTWRVVLYIFTALIAAAHYWAFKYFAGHFNAERSIWTVVSLTFLVLGWIAILFWARAPLPARVRWQRAIRSSVMIFAGVGGLLGQAGLGGASWAAIVGAVVAIVISHAFFRSVGTPSLKRSQ